MPIYRIMLRKLPHTVVMLWMALLHICGYGSPKCCISPIAKERLILLSKIYSTVGGIWTLHILQYTKSRAVKINLITLNLNPLRPYDACRNL